MIFSPIQPLSGRIPDRINVKDFGAVGDGVANDVVAFNRAIAAANARPFGGEVYAPVGRYRIVTTNGNVRILPKSNVLLRGAGRGLSVLFMDDSAGGTDMIGNTNNSGGWLPLDNFHMRDLTLLGRGDVDRTMGGQILALGGGTNITLDNVESIYSRNMGMVIAYCDQVTVKGCRVFRSMADGIAVWACPNVTITDNEITGANDDAISAQSNDDQAGAVRSGVIINDNRIVESQGIAVSGCKAVMIAGNILRRIMGSGIRCKSPDTGAQGVTPTFALTIENNIIADVFLRSEPSPRNSTLVYIQVVGGTRRAGGLSAPPGEPVSGTGVVQSFFGPSGPGYFYGNNADAGGVPTMAGHWVRIVNNTLVRTLPAVSAVSDWGYGASGLWVGNNGDGSGFYNGAIAEAALNTYGITLEPALWNSEIKNNIIATTGPWAIFFANVAGTVDLDFNNLIIDGNLIADCKTGGIGGTAPTKIHRLRITNNNFDIDPRFVHSLRAAGGTWSATTTGRAIDLTNRSGVIMERNSFRNCSIPHAGLAANVSRGNTYYCDPAAAGYSASNKGIGDIPFGDGDSIHIIEDCDPTSATFGQIKHSTPVQAGAMPSSGFYMRGHWVKNVLAGGTVAGWVRCTTGNAHVAGTDWKTITIA